jgi:anti-anti-sigma factor
MLKPTVEVRNEGGVLVSEFWDCLRLDPAPVRDLRQHYEGHLRGGGKPDLIVDLNGVVFAGSAALGGFLALHRLTRQNGGRVVFCNVDENVHEVFRISKLTPMFVFAADRPAALALINSQSTNGHGPKTDPAGSGPTPAAAPPANPTAPPAPRRDGPLRRNRRGSQ